MLNNPCKFLKLPCLFHSNKRTDTPTTPIKIDCGEGHFQVLGTRYQVQRQNNNHPSAGIYPKFVEGSRGDLSVDSRPWTLSKYGITNTNNPQL